jgi:hypothetical protein
MNWSDRRKRFKRIVWFVVVASLTGAGLMRLPTSTARAALPPRPATPTPVPQTVREETAADTKPVGAWIQISVSNVTTQSVIVQWQDTQGEWHDVTSWGGQFDTLENGMGIKTWWVDQSLFGTPNFRWIVLDAKGQMLTPSQVFTLPTEKNQTLAIQVSLVP